MVLLTSASIQLKYVSLVCASERMYKRLTPGLWTHKHQGDEGISYFTNLHTKAECGMKCRTTHDCDGFIWYIFENLCELLSKVNFCPIPHQNEMYYSYHIKKDENNGGELIMYFHHTYYAFWANGIQLYLSLYIC